jgi:signal transduction histidine kinase
MEPGIALGGWPVAVIALVAALCARRALMRRLELVARACHELRGPITAARLGLELGARPGGLSAARLRAVDLELRRASLAVDDLSQLGAGRRPVGECEEVDVLSLLVDLVEGLRATAEIRGCSLELTCGGGPLSVLGSRLRLAQAVGNLIENAIEHGGGAIEVRVACDGPCRGGCAEVAAEAAGRQPATVKIELVDEGPGLPRSVAELVRENRHNRSRHGHGLAVAVDVAVAHGGHLGTAPSERGARLVMELPAVAARALGADTG